MEKDFTPYEIALALKELGFDEPCFGTWDRPDKLWIGHVLGIDYTPDDTILAPTFSQAFRWFREKYTLNVSQERDGGWWLFHIVDTSNEDTEGSVEVEGSHIHREKYEEAELECLIRLIELVKKQQL